MSSVVGVVVGVVGGVVGVVGGVVGGVGVVDVVSGGGVVAKAPFKGVFGSRQCRHSRRCRTYNLGVVGVVGISGVVEYLF